VRKLRSLQFLRFDEIKYGAVREYRRKVVGTIADFNSGYLGAVAVFALRERCGSILERFFPGIGLKVSL
jgi:hypothetical protein